MAELPANIVETLERYRNPPNKLRSVQEINARYRQTLDNYNLLHIGRRARPKNCRPRRNKNPRLGLGQAR